jgi:hypothetical protein
MKRLYSQCFDAILHLIEVFELKYNKEIKYKIEFSEHLNKDYILEKQYFY